MLNSKQFRKELPKRVEPMRFLLKHLQVTPRKTPRAGYNERGLKLSSPTQRDKLQMAHRRLQWSGEGSPRFYSRVLIIPFVWRNYPVKENTGKTLYVRTVQGDSVLPTCL